jgi:hypothetical protein
LLLVKLLQMLILVGRGWTNSYAGGGRTADAYERVCLSIMTLVTKTLLLQWRLLCSVTFVSILIYTFLIRSFSSNSHLSVYYCSICKGCAFSCSMYFPPSIAIVCECPVKLCMMIFKGVWEK